MNEKTIPGHTSVWSMCNQKDLFFKSEKLRTQCVNSTYGFFVLESSIMKKNKVIKGRWYKINKKIKKRIVAKYHKIKDWVMDPRGYFLIEIDREKKLLRVGYCKFTKLGNKPINDMVSIVSGRTAIEIVNTLIRNKYISTLQHAADMGIELCKAELALKYKLNYVQDKDLKIK